MRIPSGNDMNYENYGMMLMRSARQAGKTGIHFAQMINWLSFHEHQQDFKPLVFGLKLADVKEDSNV